MANNKAVYFLSTVLALLLLGYVAEAQDETKAVFENDILRINNDTIYANSEAPTLILVPFEPKMYMSQIDRSIGANDGTNYNQIVANWRRGLDNMLFIETDAKFKVIRLMAEDENRQKDLYAFYGNSKFEYREIEPSKNETSSERKKLSVLKSKKKEEETKEHGTRVENGQIVSHNDGKNRFMARVIADSGLFNYMHNKYESVVYVFVNQFNVGPMDGLDYRAYESDEYQRQIKVHYTIYAHNQELYSGVATSYFSSTVNSQKDIILENFPGLASQISAHIPKLVSK